MPPKADTGKISRRERQDARKIAHVIAETRQYDPSMKLRNKVEVLFAHPKSRSWAEGLLIVIERLDAKGHVVEHWVVLQEFPQPAGKKMKCSVLPISAQCMEFRKFLSAKPR